MKRRIAIFISILWMLTISLNAQTMQLKDHQVVVTLGNSITEMGEAPDGYVNIMRKAMAILYPEMRVYFVNAGISGHKSTDMDARFERDVLQYSPDWVTISVGVNDVWHGFLAKKLNRSDLSSVSLPLYKDKVASMVQRAQQRGIKVAILTTTVIQENLFSNENKALESYNKALRDIAKKYHCLLVDQDAAFRKVLQPLQKPDMADQGILTSDGVHMLPSGNWLMAETALLSFGVPADRLMAARSHIDDEIKQEKEAFDKSISRYVKMNYEVGQPCEGGRRIVFYGSSSVDMWNLAKDFPKIPFMNRGIGGENSRQMWLRYEQDVIELKPTAVILFLGSCNDFWPDVRMCVQETKSNLSRMARMAQADGIMVAVGSLSPVNDYVPGKDYISSHPISTVLELNQWIKNLCDQNGYTFIDFYTPVADATGKLNTKYSNDGMHCNASGYSCWRQQVMKTLNKWGFSVQQ